MEKEPLTKEPESQPDGYNSTEVVPPLVDKADEGKGTEEKKDSDAGDEKLDKEDKLDFVPAFVLSCLSFWFCGIIFGGVAFILAIVGKNKADSGDRLVAGRLRVSSYVVSVLGILVGTAVLVFFLVHYRSVVGNVPFHG